jgi:hypothetical protein
LIIQIDRDSLFSTFNVEEFSQLNNSTQSMAPSMVEYFLSDLATSSDSEPSYINKSNIQETLFLGEYSLYIDYSNNIYLEFVEKEDEYETQSLW